MNAELEALGQRAVACKHWAWREGMLTTCGKRVYEVNNGYPSAIDPVTGVLHVDLGLKWLPDLSDAATVGAVLGLVREAWKEPHIHCRYDAVHKDWFTRLISCGFDAKSEAESLIAALEAAP